MLLNVEDLTVLDRNTPKQGIESSQIDNNVKTIDGKPVKLTTIVAMMTLCMR